MADAIITYGCGCGYKTRSLAAAVEHSDNTHHMVEVRGTIKPIKKTTPATSSTRMRAPVQEETMQQDISSIEALREKFSKVE